MLNSGIPIDMTRSHYSTSRNAIIKAGLIPTDDESESPYVWIDGILSRDQFKDYLGFQRINKIPGMEFVCFKSTLFKSLNEMRQLYPHAFDIYPKTCILPHGILEVQREHMIQCGKSIHAPSWVIKPANSCCGKGIRIMQSMQDMKEVNEPSVAQIYISPFLIDDRKFDFRFYLLIASLDPLTIFIYQEGIARFCSEKYEPPSKSNRNKKFIHLTNTSINVKSDVPPEEFTKKSSEIIAQISKMDQRGTFLWGKICEVSRAAIIGCYPTILATLPKPSVPPGVRYCPDKYLYERTNSSDSIKPARKLVVSTNSKCYTHWNSVIMNYQIHPQNPVQYFIERQEESVKRRRLIEYAPPKKELPPEAPSRLYDLPDIPLKKRFFHVIGIDILIDNECNPRLLELNDRPSLEVTIPFERELKEKMLSDVFYHVVANGDTKGNNVNSGWQQIYPNNNEQWDFIMNGILHPDQVKQQKPTVSAFERQSLYDIRHSLKSKKVQRKHKQ